MVMRRKTRQQKRPKDPAKLRDPFDAVVHRAPRAEARVDGNTGAQLRMELTPKPGVQERLARWLGFRRAVRVNLDEHGTAFWDLVDGERNLRDIERSLRDQLELEEDESKRATILFARALMLRGMLYVELDMPAKTLETES